MAQNDPVSPGPTHPAVPGGALGRRAFLQHAGMGAGIVGLARLLQEQGVLRPSSRAAGSGVAKGVGAAGQNPTTTHFPAKAQSVIWLFMYGGPSGIDLFDPKPELNRRHGEALGETVDAFFGKPGPLMRTPFAFAQHGQSGAWVCDRFPALAGCVDDIAFLRSCRSGSNNHAPALLQMNTGLPRMGFPSAGSWVTYGLGSENRDLPGFVVMYDPRGVPVGGQALWGSGFLPGAHQGTHFRPTGSPLLDLDTPTDVSIEGRRAQLDLLARLNQEYADHHPGEEVLAARLESFELAYRMQSEAPKLVDLSGESAATQKLYGMDNFLSRPFGTQLLMARRMVEQGVRFVQVYSGGPGGEWDAHANLRRNHHERCAETDQPIAGLLTDLKQRGLLANTLVVWGGEFGRLPVSQGTLGRDHNPHGFVTWMAGGGVRGGVSHGATDPLGYRAVQDPVSVPDLHATILHLLGLDHRHLRFLHQGRPYRLTDTAGEVVRSILA